MDKENIMDKNLDKILLQVIEQSEKNQDVLIKELSNLFEKICLSEKIDVFNLKNKTMNLVDETQNENVYYSFLMAFDLLEKKYFLEKNKDNIEIISNIFSKIESLEDNNIIMNLFKKLFDKKITHENIIKIAQKSNFLKINDKTSTEFLKYLTISKMLINVNMYKNIK